MFSFQYMIYCGHVCAELPYIPRSERTRLDFYNTIGMQFYVIKQ